MISRKVIAYDGVGMLHNLMGDHTEIKAQHHYIKAWREFRGFTQQEVADAVGMTKVNVSRIENFHRGYTQETLESFAFALICAPQDLLRPPPKRDIPRLYAALEGRGIELDKLAAKIGLTIEQVISLVTGLETPTFHEAKRIAEETGIKEAELFAYLGIQFADPDRYLARVRGTIRADDVIELSERHGIDEIPTPFSGWWGHVYIIEGDAYAPRYRNGEYLGCLPPLFVGEEMDSFGKSLDGKECAVFVDGEPMLKIVQPGGLPETYTLLSLNPTIAPLLDVKVSAGAPVEWHLPRTTFSAREYALGRAHHQAVMDEIHNEIQGIQERELTTLATGSRQENNQ